MTYECITPPAALAVSLAAVRETLRMEAGDTSLDLTLTRWVKAITLVCEHAIGRSLITQGRRLTLDAFPDALRLDQPKTISVQSIQYYDTDNALQTLDPQDYYADLVTEPGYIVPAAGAAWPATYDRVNAVIVDYTCGYGATEASVPANVQTYILTRMAELFDPVTREFKETSQSRFVERLLDQATVYG